MKPVKWTDKIKNAVVLERVGEGRTVGTDKEEEKILVAPLLKKELPAEGCSRTGPPKLQPAGLIRPTDGFSVACFSRMYYCHFLVWLLVTRINYLAKLKYE